MESKEKLPSMKFSGASMLGNISTKRDIIISGGCKVDGDIECNSFKCSGSVVGAGNITAHGNFKTSGRMKLEGNVRSEETFHSSGSVTINGSVYCGKIFDASSSVNISGSVQCGDKFLSSGSVKIGDFVECGGDFKNSGGAKIQGKLFVHGSLHSSGRMKVFSFIKCEKDAKFSGSTKVQEDITVNGVLNASGRIEGEFVKAKKGIQLSGKTEIFNDLESEEYINVMGGLRIEGDLIAKRVFFKDNKFWIININPDKYYREIKGNIEAKESVDINRAFVEGNIKGRSVSIGRYCKIIGKIFYADKIIVNKSAELANDPIKIDANQL